jgi:hypothetical protein
MENQTSQNQTTSTPPLQPVVPQVPPVELPKPEKNNLVVILLSVLLIIALFINSYLFLRVQSLTKQLAQVQVEIQATPIPSPISTSTPDVTASWKTYTNTKYGYSIKYPTEGESGLTFFICEEGKEYNYRDYKIRYSQPFDLIALEKEGITVPCGPMDSYYTIEVRAQSGKPLGTNELESFESATSLKEQIAVDGINGIKATFTKTRPAPVPDKWIEILVFKNGRRYHLILSDMTYEEIFDQILSTFKFLE